MDKNVLKKFAIESRQELMDKVFNKIKKFYIDEEFKVNQNGEICVLSNEKHTLSLTKKEYENRQLLIKRINEITLEQVIEEAAYTWFNRIIAIRYMEIHDYLPLTKDNQSLGIRVLSSKDNTPDPEIMKISNLINPELDIEFNKEYYSTIQDNNKRFEYILLLVCKKLGKVIPQVFDGITDYIDILIPDNLLNESGYITKVLKDVSEDNYEQVEIIGWLYQYYNQIEKDRVINSKKVRSDKETTYVTQLFTPDWIVKYMVENTLVPLLGKHLNTDKYSFFTKNDLNYENVDIEKIKFLDPCCGSGHILVYAFDIFYEAYKNNGYSESSISQAILNNNIFGLELDYRATQLSVLSVILKARSYDKNIFNKEIQLNVLEIKDTLNISQSVIEFLKYSGESLNDDELQTNKVIDEVIKCFKDAKTYGSLIDFKSIYLKKIEERIKELTSCASDIFMYSNLEVIKNELLPVVRVADILNNKYECIVTNPPYMGSNLMNSKLKDFINNNYRIAKSDLFASFIIKCQKLSVEKGYIGLLTPYVWLFIKSYEELRKHILDTISISNMVQLEYNGFEAACIPVAAYTFVNDKTKREGTYIKLSEFKGSENQPIKTMEAINNDNCSFKYKTNMDKFYCIPGYTYAFWASDNFINMFSNFDLLSDFADAKSGISTGDNNLFLRNWHEVDFSNIKFECKNINDTANYIEKWYPYNKGGSYRKWYGNNDLVVNWKNNGKDIRNFKGSTIRNASYHFLRGLTWSTLSSSYISFRYNECGFLFDSKGANCILHDNNDIYMLMGYLNSTVVEKLLEFLSPTLDFNPGPISKLPYIKTIDENIINKVKQNIELSKKEWDCFESSWDFKKYEFIKKGLIKDIIVSYKNKFMEYKEIIRKNEEEINKYYIDLFDLKSDVDYRVDENRVAIEKIDDKKIVCMLINYSVGCMLGRYSLDKDGLVFAGGDFDEHNYKIFKADTDNIIPLTDETYFSDDIVTKFKEFIEVAFGKDTLYSNLEFIAGTLGKRNGESNEETIRRYFINDFFNEHIKMYQKKPIYWLFDSGKKNGFKCLIYMHRYNKGTVSKIRLDYLHKMQNTYEKELNEINQKLLEELSLQDKKELTKKQSDLNAKLQETKEYDEKIAHIADQAIEIDLDDGVAVNYAKFSVKNPKTGKEESILANSKEIAIKKKKEE